MSETKIICQTCRMSAPLTDKQHKHIHLKSGDAKPWIACPTRKLLVRKNHSCDSYKPKP
jgi:hypothetical protein